MEYVNSASVWKFVRCGNSFPLLNFFQVLLSCAKRCVKSRLIQIYDYYDAGSSFRIEPQALHATPMLLSSLSRGCSRLVKISSKLLLRHWLRILGYWLRVLGHRLRNLVRVMNLLHLLINHLRRLYWLPLNRHRFHF